MCHYVDLSYVIENEMPTHPYDEKMKLYKSRYLKTHKYNDTRIEMGMHVGTHIDVKSHLSEDEILISEYPPVKFVGKGCLLDVRNEAVIRMRKEYFEMIGEDDIVLLFTGHDKLFGTEQYFSNHPVMSKELAQYFVDRKIKLLGMDLPSPDRFPFEVHKLLLGNDILLIENMTNLEKLINVKNFEVIAFPLNIRAEAAPTRVVARVIE